MQAASSRKVFALRLLRLLQSESLRLQPFTPNQSQIRCQTSPPTLLPLSSGPVTQMLLVKKNGKEYLQFGLDSSTNVAILDVSEPSQPRTIDTPPGVAGTPSPK
jgi:hypothetical protein